MIASGIAVRTGLPVELDGLSFDSTTPKLWIGATQALDLTKLSPSHALPTRLICALASSKA